MKKSLRRVLVALMCVIMLATCVFSASAAKKTYTDVKSGDWYYGFVSYMSEKEIINGYTNNTFRPNDFVKRAEFIKMMVETFGLEDESTISYTDVDEDDWYYDYYQKAKAQGFLSQVFTGNTMKPTDYLTREEACALLMAYLAYPASDVASSDKFVDYYDIDSDYRTYVLQAVYAGIIDGFKEDDGDYTFRPEESLRRAQAAKILSVAAGTIADDDISDEPTFDGSENLVVVDDVTITDLEIPGNVIISESVTSGTVTFINCKIGGTVYNRGVATVVFSGCEVDEICVDAVLAKVQLKQATEVDNLSVNALGSRIEFQTGATVDSMLVNSGVTGVYVTDLNDNGKINKLTVKANSLNCDIVPATCVVESGFSATIGDVKYAAGFKGDPRTMWEGDLEYLYFETYAAGTIKYYYTSEAGVPTAATFNTKYNAALYKSNFTVAKDALTKKPVFGADVSTTDYPYVVMALVEGTTVGKPIAINRTADKSGFTVMPTLTVSGTNEAIKVAPKYEGTLYYYYTNDATVPADFLSARAAYNASATTVRGTISFTSVSTSAVTKVTKTSEAVEGYAYCVVFYQGEGGGFFDPVLLEKPSMTSGFSTDPSVIVSTETGGKDKLTVKASSGGTLYWFYTNSSVDFTASYFNDLYAVTASGLKGTTSVSANQEKNIDLAKSADVSTYSYVVIMLKSSGGNHLPVVVARKSSATGFKGTPTLIKTNDNDILGFETTVDGAVKYLYISSNLTYTVDNFNTAYEAAEATHKAYEELNAGAHSFQTKSGLTEGYVAIMFIDANGTSYKPVTVVRTPGGTGFSGAASVLHYIADSKTELTVNTLFPVNIDYYETDIKTVPSFEQFAALGASEGGVKNATASAKGEQKIEINVSGAKKYVAIMATVSGNRLNPIVVEYKEIDYGAKLDGVSPMYLNSNGFHHVQFVTSEAGSFQYYYTNVLPTSAAGFNSGYANAKCRSTIEVGSTKAINTDTYLGSSICDYKYFVYRFTGTSGVVYAIGHEEIAGSIRNGGELVQSDSGEDLTIRTNLNCKVKVYYFYSAKDLTLTSKTFQGEYNSASATNNNKKVVDFGGNKINDGTPHVVTGIKDQTTSIKYLYAALQDENGNFYAPVKIELTPAVVTP